MTERTSKNEIVRRLRALGDERVPGPRPDFVDGLESRLRAGALAMEPEVDTEPAMGGRVIPLRRSLTISGAVVASAAAIVIGVLVLPSRSARTTLTLGRATDTEVIQPDGRIADARPGTVVPDGAIVRTGPTGQTTADGAELGPNTEAIALDGQLHAVGGGPDHRLTDDGITGRSPTLQLNAHRNGSSTVVLRWTPSDKPGLYGYVILRVASNGSPDYARDAVGFTTGTTLVDHRAPAGALIYRIVAVDRQGRVLAVSPAAGVGR